MLPPISEAEQNLIALEEAVTALTRMVDRGVSKLHIPGSALFMVAVSTLEQTVSRKGISIWLEKLAQQYRDSSHLH